MTGTARIESTANGVTTIVIDRPQRGNSVTPELMADMAQLLSRADADPTCRAVVITGSGKVFCSGADVVEMREYVAAHGVDAFAEYMVGTWLPAVQDTFRMVCGMRPLVVAAMNGAAVGGGLALALLCDLRVAFAEARLSESHVKVGVLPAAGSILQLTRILGTSSTLRAVLVGGPSDARTAMGLGLVDEVVEAPTEVLARAVAVAEELTVSGRNYVAAAKRLVRAGELAALDAHFAHCLAENAALFAEPDGLTGLAHALS